MNGHIAGPVSDKGDAGRSIKPGIWAKPLDSPGGGSPSLGSPGVIFLQTSVAAAFAVSNPITGGKIAPIHQVMIPFTGGAIFVPINASI